MNLYRAKYAIRNGSASSGSWEYYENEDSLKADLIVAALEVEAEKPSTRGAKYRIISAWIRHLRGTNDFYPRYTNIFSVEKVDNDEWVPVEFTFLPPEVRLD